MTDQRDQERMDGFGAEGRPIGTACRSAAFVGSLLAALLAAAPSAQAQIECLAGTPFGVGQIELRVPSNGNPAPRVSEKTGRLFYPVVLRERRGVIINRGEHVTALFLFHGQEPLQIEVHTQQPVSLVVTPQAGGQRAYRKLLDEWWELYYSAAQERVEQAAYPPLAESYLTAMLSQRLGLAEPRRRLSRRERREANKPLETLELLAGAERLRTSALRHAMLGSGGFQHAPLEVAVPPALPWREPHELPPDEDVQVEPIAKLAPPECFYVRFGSFSNFLWLLHLTREQGGDLGRMITARSLERNMNKRFERQFALRYSVLADLLGDQAISDLAVVGRDLYLPDGAAMGVLVEARNTFLLDTALGRERSAALAREQANGATTKKVKIAGREVELLSTPDNAVLSYLAPHDKYRLVTTSRQLVERFYEVVDGGRSLGDTLEFRRARSQMPLDRQDTLFAYFSRQFFQGLASPQYQIELRRRLRSQADMQLLELAEMAARNEGLPNDVPQMITYGLLPEDMLHRADGSQLQRRDGQWVDTLRGGRGTFLPIPDVPLNGLTRGEMQQYAEVAAYYRDQWSEIDPLIIGVRRFALEQEGRERLVVDAQVSPFVEQQYGRLLSLLGDPAKVLITAPPDAVISGQASLRGGVLMPHIPAHQLFFGILDRCPEIESLKTDGLIDKLRLAQSIPGYAGGWPKPGFLDFMLLSPRRQEDAEGYARLPFRLWRRNNGEFSVIAFDKGILEQATPHLRLAEAPTEAHAWLNVGDLTETKLAPWIRELNYQRALEVSLGNTRLLTTMMQQFGVAPQQAPGAVRRLAGAELTCPLEGELQWNGSAWVSTAWTPDWSPPADYASPLLAWFRGGSVRMLRVDGQLTVHGHIDMQRAADSAMVSLPKFDLPNPFSGLFGGQKPQAEEKPEPKKKSGPREF